MKELITHLNNNFVLLGKPGESNFFSFSGYLYDLFCTPCSELRRFVVGGVGGLLFFACVSCPLLC